MNLSIRVATLEDADEIVALRIAAADDLTARFGKGHWSSNTTGSGVLLAMKRGRVLIASEKGAIAGTLTLSTRKPWAIDTAYFTRVKLPIYLTSMAVLPAMQGKGVGRGMLAAAEDHAGKWGEGAAGNAIRLDAFDANAGAGAFYAKCGYTEKGRTVFRTAPLIYFEKILAP